MRDMTVTNTQDGLTVGRVAQTLGVSVRTLHHYDEIGLVTPAGRTPAGYRLYTEDDLTRLQHVVVYRRLGFTLEEVADLLDDPGGVESHLRRQRAAVMSRLDEMRGLVAAIDRALETTMSNLRISRDEQRELFGDAFDEHYAAEAREKYGDHPEWAAAQRRAASYDKEQWQRIAAEDAGIKADLAAIMASGRPADDAAAMDVAERQRRHICDWWYDCSPAMHARVATTFTDDARTASQYEEVAPGLAAYARQAVEAHAARAESA